MASTPPTADLQTKTTFCRVCHASCPMEVDVVDNRVVAVRGVLDDPLFEGYTCIKGRQLPDQMADPNRLRAPLRRRPDGTFEQVDSADALDEIAAELRRIIDTYGPRAVASYTGTGGYQNSVAVPAARAFHQGLDSVSFYTSVTIDQPAKGLAGLRLGAWEAGYHNFTDSDVHMAIGYNPMVSSYGPIGGLQGTNPFVVMRRRKAEGMKLIVIDPRRTEMASFADIHLQVRPGEDPTLLAGHDQDRPGGRSPGPRVLRALGEPAGRTRGVGRGVHPRRRRRAVPTRCRRHRGRHATCSRPGRAARPARAPARTWRRDRA